MSSRRDFLTRGALAVLAPAGLSAIRAGRLAAQGPAPQDIQAPVAGSGEIGRLADPTAVGRSQVPTSAADNSEAIKAIELRLACSCGCTLDVFTCRTTDFSCTYSPAMHRQVVALYDEGKTAQQIIDAFVAEYGEKVLMAPPAEGFNLAGYLVPGAVIAAFGALLVWIIGRRRQVAAAALVGTGSPAPDVAASPEELERLRRALEDVDA